MFMFTVKRKNSFFAAATTFLANKDRFSNPRHDPIVCSIRDTHSGAKIVINGFSKRVLSGFELLIFVEIRETKQTVETLEPITGRTANFGNFRTVKRRENEQN